MIQCIIKRKKKPPDKALSRSALIHQLHAYVLCSSISLDDFTSLDVHYEHFDSDDQYIFWQLCNK